MSENLTLTEAVALVIDYEAAEVADLMRACGITGKQANVHHCPMAQWLHLVTGRNVEVYEDTISTVRGDYNTPEGVANFIRTFDEGGYPDLVRHKA